MILDRFKKERYTKSEAVALLRSILSKSQQVGLKAFLVSVGNYSKRDYIQLSKDLDARLLADRPFFVGWFKWLSFLVPASWIGALALNSQVDCSETVINLADHGDIWIILSRDADIDGSLRKIVEEYSIRNGWPEWLARFPSDTKAMILNGETPDIVEVHMDFTQGDLQ